MKLLTKNLSDLNHTEKKFIEKNSSSIYQSLKWAEFMLDFLGTEPIVFFGTHDNNEILIYSIGYKYPIKFGYYWLYLAKISPLVPLSVSPLVSTSIFEDRKKIFMFLDLIKNFVDKKCVWIRFDPDIEFDEELSKEFQVYKKAHVKFHPDRTLVLDLNLSEDEMLAQMHPKGRYNIRLAEKKGVEIFGFKSDGLQFEEISLGNLDKVENFNQDFDPVSVYYNIASETSLRDKFQIHSEKYFRDFLNKLSDNSFILLAKFEDKWIAGGIFTNDHETCIYYYGASTNEFRNLMAPYLLQWSAIRYARNVLNCKVYDFLGISDSDDKNDKLAGVTDFKMKFGGKIIKYIGTFEIVKNWFIYNIILLIKRVKGKR